MLLLAAGNEGRRKRAKEERKSDGGKCKNCHAHLCWVWMVLPHEKDRPTKGLTSDELRHRAEEDDEVKDEIGKLITHQCGLSQFGCGSPGRCYCKCGKFLAEAEDQQAKARTGALVGGAMMTRRGPGRGRPVLGAVVIGASVHNAKSNRKKAEERRRRLVAPYKGGKINPKDFCIPIEVHGSISINDPPRQKSKTTLVSTTTTTSTVKPVVITEVVQQPVLVQQQQQHVFVQPQPQPMLQQPGLVQQHPQFQTVLVQTPQGPQYIQMDLSTIQHQPQPQFVQPPQQQYGQQQPQGNPFMQQPQQYAQQQPQFVQPQQYGQPQFVQPITNPFLQQQPQQQQATNPFQQQK